MQSPEALRFESIAAVALDDVVVLVFGVEPPTVANEWPVRIIPCSLHMGLKEKPCQPHERVVLCGLTSVVSVFLESHRVRAELSSGDFPTPIYVVTDSSGPCLYEVPNVTVDGLDAGDLEPAVRAICARHVRSVPHLILDHALRTPDAEAVCDEGGSLTYAELLYAAWAFGEHLLTRVPACADSGTARVGVQLAPSISSCCILLGLGLRRLTACDIAEDPRQREYMLEEVFHGDIETVELPEPVSCRADLQRLRVYTHVYTK